MDPSLTLAFVARPQSTKNLFFLFRVPFFFVAPRLPLVALFVVAAKARTLTGNVIIDFPASDLQVRSLNDGVVPDVIMPQSPAFAGRVSGWDFANVRLAYEASTDTLFLGFDCFGESRPTPNLNFA